MERQLRRKLGPRSSAIISALVFGAVLIAAWQIAGTLTNAAEFATPIATARAFSSVIGNGRLWPNLADTLLELYTGVAIASVLGIVIGLLIGRYQLVNYQLKPYVNFLSAIPGVILIPLCVAWVGIGTEAQVVFVALITIFPVLLNALAGMQNAKRELAEVGASLRLSEWTLFRNVLFPSCGPYILSGLRIAASLGMIGIIVAQMEVSSSGLGFMLQFYAGQLKVAQVLAVIVVTSLISLFNVMLLNIVGRRWMGWFAYSAR